MEEIINRAFNPVRTAIETGKIPGAQLGIVTKSGARAVKFGGFAQIQPEKIPISENTIFDLASVTKVMFTTIEVLKHVECGAIALDDALSKHIPDFRQYDLNCDERKVTIRQCLTHQTFFPAVEPIYTKVKDPLQMRAYILQREWQKFEPRYSDINFLLLGILLERLKKRPLKEIETPKGTSFSPDTGECAATEFCTWRNRIIRGEVHDENAFAFGGASGHAGLFGNINNVLDFAFDLMNEKLLAAEMTNALFERQTPTRSLGFEMKYENWSGGQNCSPETIGHTGFTGTGIWIDKTREIAWSLLTNRVHPSRHFESGIVQLRREVGEIICQNVRPPLMA